MTCRPLALAVFIALFAQAAVAEEAPVTELAPVSVTMTRDPAIVPYAEINALLLGLARHGQGLFRMDFRLTAKDPKKPLVAPRLALAHGDTETPIPLAADGTFTLPTLPVAEGRDAQIASNQPKGSLRVEGSIELTTPPDALDMASVRRILATARTLRGELLPWYARWLFPRIDAVRICSTQAAWSLQWTENGERLAVPLAADPQVHDREPFTGAASDRVCTTLTGHERWPDAARLVTASPTRLGVLFGR